MPYRSAIDQPPSGPKPDATEPGAPVILFGALRSGTTLMRLMTNAHPAINNPGEVDFLTDHISPVAGSATEWRYNRSDLRADRMFRAQNIEFPDALDGLDLLHFLLNRLAAKSAGLLCVNMHRKLDLALRLMPNARVIHLLRDPRDVARSSVAMGWSGQLYFGADHWVQTEQGWDLARARLAPDQWMELRYEDLMTQPRAELARVCDFVGVPYSDAMLSYPAHSTYALPDPALSRQWVHRCTVQDVADLESRIEPMMVARGYALSRPVQAPGPLRLARLRVLDWAGRWKFGIRAFGAVPYLGARVAHKLRLKALERHFQKRIDKRIRQMLR